MAFVQHDLMTVDPASAGAFYAALFGWRLETVEVEFGSYSHIYDGERRAGGIVGIGAGSSSHWMPVVAVHDLEGVLERVRAEGGAVELGPHCPPRGNAFAVIADDCGAHLTLAERVVEVREGVDPGQFCWAVHHSADLVRAEAFYTAVLGWSGVDRDGGEGRIRLLAAEGSPVAGLSEDSKASRWSCAVAVADVAQSYARAIELGGLGIEAPAMVGSLGVRAELRDPTGASVTLWRREDGCQIYAACP